MDDRVQWLQNTNGCVLCGDWTGTHQRDSCQSGYSGCRKCGKKHMDMLHGSANKFAGLVHISNQVTSTKARRRPRRNRKNKSAPSAMTENYRVDPAPRVEARVDGQRTSGGSPAPTTEDSELERSQVTFTRWKG